jgi:SAM-dependent methyltransferase
MSCCVERHDATRGPYRGVLQILQYNRRFYGSALAGVAISLFIAPRVTPMWRVLLLSGAALTLFWLCSSLLVSHYIYDRFPLYDLSWLARCLSQPPQRWVNINAGLDETSHLLAALFPSAEGQVLDIYDPGEMTERSIKLARRITPASAQSIPADWRTLPLPDNEFDAALLMFAAHELRRHEARVQLFRELARVLRPGGEVALVEHSRDWANFLAFGPGFLHFFSKQAWRRAADAARLQVRTDFSMTPFVHVFILRRLV